MPSDFQYRGFHVAVRGPYRTGRGYVRYKVSILETLTERKLVMSSNQRDYVIDLPEETLPDISTIQPYLDRLLQREKSLLMRQMMTGEWHATLEQYTELQADAIALRAKWMGTAADKKRRCAEIVYPIFENLQLKEISDAEVKARIENKYRLGVRHEEVPEEVHEIYLILNDILNSAVTDRLLSSNPVKNVAKKHKRSRNEIILRNTSIRSLSLDQLRKCLEACAHIAEPGLQTAMRVYILTGLSPAIITALDLEHLCSDNLAYWITIVRKYIQERGAKPVMIELLDNLNEYRYFPCTDVLWSVLHQQLAARKAQGAKPGTPLFVDDETGERLAPQKMIAMRKMILTSIGLTPARAEKDGLRMFREDVFAQSADFWYRELGNMSLAEVSVLMGRDREDTYAQYYVDWTSPLVLRQLAKKIARWHRKLVDTGDCPEDGDIMYFCRVRVLKSGAAVSLQSDSGVRGSAYRMEG